MDAPVSSVPSPSADPREQALVLLELFRARVLPSFLRRLRTWSGFDPAAHADVVDDVCQEIALDCVRNAASLLAMTPPARHRRWLRLAQRQHYELRVRAHRRSERDPDVQMPGTPPPTALELDLAPDDRTLLEQVARHAERLANGRICARSTARAMRIGRARLRRVWSAAADATGIDHEQMEFWRQRLAEALCMIAAARLRESGAVRLWDDGSRRAYDRVAFRRRVERIRDALVVRPIDADVRRTIELVAPRRDARQLTPRDLLVLAEQITICDPLVLLWRFEAEVADGGDLSEAARCLWEVRHRERDRVRLVLARARLLEARGRLRAARALLARAVARRELIDPRLMASLRAAGGVPGKQAPSARTVGRRCGRGEVVTSVASVAS